MISGEEKENPKKKYISKTTRLSKSLEHGAKLLETSQNKVSVKSNYYERKLAILERDSKNNEWFQKKQVAIGEQTLKEFTEIKEILLKKFC